MFKKCLKMEFYDLIQDIFSEQQSQNIILEKLNKIKK